MQFVGPIAAGFPPESSSEGSRGFPAGFRASPAHSNSEQMAASPTSTPSVAHGRVGRYAAGCESTNPTASSDWESTSPAK